MTWAWDAPTGVYKNHALSSKIREEAARNFEFVKWLDPEPGYGRQRGDTITVTRIKQLPVANRVSEQDDLPSGRPAISTKSVTVSEWGFKIELTSKEQLLTHFEPRTRFRRFLRDQISQTLDVAAATALKTTPIKFQTTSATAGTFTTNGTPAGQAQNNLSIAHLRLIRDYMRGTLNVPTLRNGLYVGILSTRAARGIKNDSEYKDWLSPTDSTPFTTGRLKNVEDIALFETNNTRDVDGNAGALDDDIGASGVLGECVFFGADAGFLAEVLTPELRAGMPRDLGRKMEVGWYGVVEASLTWDGATDSKVVHVSST